MSSGVENVGEFYSEFAGSVHKFDVMTVNHLLSFDY